MPPYSPAMYIFHIFSRCSLLVAESLACTQSAMPQAQDRALALPASRWQSIRPARILCRV